MNEGMATILAMGLVLVFIVMPMTIVYIYVDRQNTKTTIEYWKKITDEFEQALDGKPMSRKFIRSILSVKEQK